jgi:RND family efflux transporter MFP subunit
VIVFLLNVYIAILALLVYLKVLPFNLFWKASPFLVLFLLLIGLFIPMGWGAPTGPALLIRNSVQIVPDVSGEVIEVQAEPNKQLKANDVLFKIDPVPFEAQANALAAQLKFQELRLGQMTQLLQRDSGRAFDVEQRQAEVDQLRAQLDGAKWNLEKTVVRAPAEGYVTNLALRKGARVASLPLSPVMAFIDTSETIVGIEIQQIDARYIAPGQEVELTFKFLPGRIFSGKVQNVLEAVSAGQVQPSGQAVTPRQAQSQPFVVRVTLDDAETARELPAGSAGTAAIFTDRVKAAHVIRRVLLRQIAIINFINPL